MADMVIKVDLAGMVKVDSEAMVNLEVKGMEDTDHREVTVVVDHPVEVAEVQAMRDHHRLLRPGEKSSPWRVISVGAES